MKAKRPNILFITTDQQRADHLGCYGNRELKTPNIDKLAGRGTCFDKFHVASPVCQPNRAAIVTGRMPSVNGVRYNGVPLPLETVTFMETLRQSGYRTSLVGKAHFQNATDLPPAQVAPEPKHPIPEGLEEPLRRGPGRYDQETHRLWREDPDQKLDLPYYGFEDVALTIEHGDDVEGDYGRWLRARHNDAENLLGPENALPAPGLVAPEAWRTAVPAEHYSSAFIRDVTVERLEELAQEDQPFFLWASFNDPHHPFTPPGKYFDMYDPDEVSLPPSFNAPHKNAPLSLSSLDKKAELNFNRYRTRDETKIRQAIALTYGLISMVDDAVGAIMAKLEDTGLADNTIVIFTSDHGDFMGDHGLLFKKYFHYRGLIRVPFIWKNPGDTKALRRGDFANALDIAPSILSACQVGANHGIQGRDLFDSAYQPVPELLIEEDDQKNMPGSDTPTRIRTLVTDKWRISVFNGLPWGELYDLEIDPHELTNLWDSPVHKGVRDTLLERLLRQTIRLAENAPMPDYIA